MVRPGILRYALENAHAANGEPRPRRRSRNWGRIARFYGRIAANRIHFKPWAVGKLWSEATKQTAAADARAGLNVALLAFPQSIAYGLVAGVPPQAGLISSGIGAIVGPLFSGSRFIVLGPTNATAILVFSGFAAAGLAQHEFLVALPLFILLTGLLQVVGSLLRFSIVLQYVSRSVVTGYISAAAALIVANQLQHALGFRVPETSTFIAVITGTLGSLGRTQWPELMISLGTLAVYLGSHRWLPRAPQVAITIVIMALVALGFRSVGLPLAYLSGFSIESFSLMRITFDLELMARLLPPALALAFVAILEGASVAKALASRSGERVDVDRELYGMGMANIASSLCGGLDASGSLTRSSLSHHSGARTALATVFSGLFVLLLLATIGFMIGAIPRAALAVLVMCIAVSLFNRHHIRLATRTTRSDSLVFAITCGTALIATLDAAIYIGVLASAIFFMRKASTPELVEYSFNEQGHLAENYLPARRVPGIAILHAEGDLFFGSADLFSQQMREVTKDPSLQVIILRLKNARNLDATAAAGIEELQSFLHAGGRHLLISGADREVTRVLRKSGLLERLGEENFFREIPANPTLSTRHALKRAQALLGQQGEVRIFVDQSKQKADEL